MGPHSVQQGYLQLVAIFLEDALRGCGYVASSGAYFQQRKRCLGALLRDMSQQSSCCVRPPEPVVNMAQIDQARGDLRGTSYVVVEPLGDDFALHVGDGCADRTQ